LRNVFVSGYVAYCQINELPEIYSFFIIDKMSARAGLNGFAGRIWPAGRSSESTVIHEQNIPRGPTEKRHYRRSDDIDEVVVAEL